PHTRVQRSLGNPPFVISSSPMIPVEHFGSCEGIFFLSKRIPFQGQSTNDSNSIATQHFVCVACSPSDAWCLESGGKRIADQRVTLMVTISSLVSAPSSARAQS